MITLSPKEEIEAKNWLMALFFYGGLTTRMPSRRSWLPEYKAKPICNEIINRQFEFIQNNLDTALADCSEYSFLGSGGGSIKRPATVLAKYIAWFCKANNIIWDDIAFNLTPYELDAIKQTTLGSALYDNECFTSAIEATKNTPAAQPNPAAAANTKTAPAKPAGAPPANSYKSSGGHSGEIPNLIGTPGAKATFPGQPMFCVEADKIGKNTPCAFITPIKVSASGSVIAVSKAQAEKVNFGSGNGYTDCALWFDNIQRALDLVNYCANQFSKYTGFHISQAKADGNGYFKVSTAAGDAYIKAKKLNEDLEKKLANISSEEQEPIYENASEGFKITDINLYDKWMHDSIS